MANRQFMRGDDPHATMVEGYDELAFAVHQGKALFDKCSKPCRIERQSAMRPAVKGSAHGSRRGVGVRLLFMPEGTG